MALEGGDASSVDVRRRCDFYVFSGANCWPWDPFLYVKEALVLQEMPLPWEEGRVLDRHRQLE